MEVDGVVANAPRMTSFLVKGPKVVPVSGYAGGMTIQPSSLTPYRRTLILLTDDRGVGVTVLVPDDTI